MVCEITIWNGGSRRVLLVGSRFSSMAMRFGTPLFTVSDPGVLGVFGAFPMTMRLIVVAI